MFAEEETEVELLCDNDMADVIIDRFSKITLFVGRNDGHFIAFVSVAVSIQFF